MMNVIGGYFGLADREQGVFPRRDGILLNTGRNSLEYILRHLPGIKSLLLPYYTCEVVLEPIKKLGISFLYYHINNYFEIDEEINLEKGQYIIVNNYFGLKDLYIEKLHECFGSSMIVDCAQALFADPLPGMKAFYSCRKYVGVADGGVACGVDSSLSESFAKNYSNAHYSHLFIRKEFGAEAGFRSYQENEHKLDNQKIQRMSDFTYDMLEHIDYEKLINIRRNNYTYLHARLKTRNKLSLPDIDTFACPMVYPFMCGSDRDLRNELISKKIYVARYWPSVLDKCDARSNEYNLAENMIPLPIDQRYGSEEMEYIIDALK